MLVGDDSCGNNAAAKHTHIKFVHNNESYKYEDPLKWRLIKRVPGTHMDMTVAWLHVSPTWPRTIYKPPDKGVEQTRMRMGIVFHGYKLPWWADGDARTFVRLKYMCAIERNIIAISLTWCEAHRFMRHELFVLIWCAMKLVLMRRVKCLYVYEVRCWRLDYWGASRSQSDPGRSETIRSFRAAGIYGNRLPNGTWLIYDTHTLRSGSNPIAVPRV